MQISAIGRLVKEEEGIGITKRFDLFIYEEDTDRWVIKSIQGESEI